MTPLSVLPAPTVYFAGTRCRVDVRHYGNQRLALQLTHADTGEPVALATLNVLDQAVNPDECLIQIHGEHQRLLLDTLIAASIIQRPHRMLWDDTIGLIPVCRLATGL